MEECDELRKKVETGVLKKLTVEECDEIRKKVECGVLKKLTVTQVIESLSRRFVEDQHFILLLIVHRVVDHSIRVLWISPQSLRWSLNRRLKPFMRTSNHCQRIAGI